MLITLVVEEKWLNCYSGVNLKYILCISLYCWNPRYAWRYDSQHAHGHQADSVSVDWRKGSQHAKMVTDQMRIRDVVVHCCSLRFNFKYHLRTLSLSLCLINRTEIWKSTAALLYCTWSQLFFKKKMMYRSLNKHLSLITNMWFQLDSWKYV